MQQDVYIDLYFLINTSMNLLCLVLTASLLHRKIHRWRAILGAAVGGAYAIGALLFGSGGVLGLVSDCAVAFVMCAITFSTKRCTVWRLLQCTAVQTLTSMILGGVMTALYSMLNRLHLPFEALQGDNLSVWSLAILSAFSGLITAFGGRFFGFSQKTKSVTLRVVVFGKEITLCAMVDTGNLLRDPVSGHSVIVAEEEQLLAILPKSLAEALKSPSVERWLSERAYNSRIRIIPTHTAAGTRMLPAIIPDSVTITDADGAYPADYLIAPAKLGENAHGFDAVIAMD